MKPLPHTPEIEALAGRIVWFEPPDKALADPIRFMAYVMAYATPDNLSVLRRYVSAADFREALDNAPPGIIDARSWAHWNLMMGRSPAPPMPQRRFDRGEWPSAWRDGPPRRYLTPAIRSMCVGGVKTRLDQTEKRRHDRRDCSSFGTYAIPATVAWLRERDRPRA